MSGRRLLLLSPLVSQVLLGLLVAAGPLPLGRTVDSVDHAGGECRRLAAHRFSSLDAAEADVTHSGVHRLRPTCCGPVAQAIAVGAQERPALDHLAADRELGLGWVITISGAA